MGSHPQSTSPGGWIPCRVIQILPWLALAQNHQALTYTWHHQYRWHSHLTSRAFLDPLAQCPVDEKHKQDGFKPLLSS